VAVLDFVVHAAGEAFDLAFDDIEAAINFREVLVDRCEFSRAGIGQRLNDTTSRSE
jgi:hypothetical protein